MNLNEYQTAAARTMRTDMDMLTALAVLGLGLTGEAGEVAEVIKKHVGHGHELDHEAITKELGDVLWYIAALATALDIDLATVAAVNVAKLRARYPDGFDSEASRNRVDVPTPDVALATNWEPAHVELPGRRKIIPKKLDAASE